MKFLTIFLSLSLASVALAQEPAELTNSRAMYELNLAKAKKQLESDYHKLMRDSLSSHIMILESYKKDAMQAGKLEEAVAYDKEIEKAKDLYSKQKFEAPKEEQPVVKTKEILEGMVGDYEAQGVKNPNDWHFDTITIEERNKQGCPVVLRWKNKAGKTWLLFPDLVEGVLRTSLDNPYYNDLRIIDLKMRHQCRNYEIVFNEKGDGVIGFNRNGFFKIMK